KEIVMQIQVGDKVLFNKYAGSQFKLDGEEVTILKQSDVLAIVEE
ncbi:MAG: co-chaperone GroES, partial [Clostridia bacterium]|nr:co-chaperone GroES [Clostridia bacterium]